MDIYMLTWWDNRYESGTAILFATEAGAKAHAQFNWSRGATISWMEEPSGDLKGLTDPEWPDGEFFTIRKSTLSI